MERPAGCVLWLGFRSGRQSALASQAGLPCPSWIDDGKAGRRFLTPGFRFKPCRLIAQSFWRLRRAMASSRPRLTFLAKEAPRPQVSSIRSSAFRRGCYRRCWSREWRSRSYGARPPPLIARTQHLGADVRATAGPDHIPSEKVGDEVPQPAQATADLPAGLVGADGVAAADHEPRTRPLRVASRDSKLGCWTDRGCSRSWKVCAGSLRRRSDR